MADELQDNYEIVRTDDLNDVVSANVRLKKFLTDLLSDPKSEKVAFDVIESALLHDNLDGLKLAGTGITYGHLNAIAQTIVGIKTFNSFPITPSAVPTSDYQVANLKLVVDGLLLKADTTAVTAALLLKANLTENTFTEKQTIKAATSDGSAALILKNSSDVEASRETDDGYRIGKGLIQSKSFIPSNIGEISNSSSSTYVDTDLIVAITPKSSTSKLRIAAQMNFGWATPQSGYRVKAQYKTGAGAWTDLVYGNNNYIFIQNGTASPSTQRAACNILTQFNSPGTSDEVQFKLQFNTVVNGTAVDLKEAGLRMITVDEIQE